MSVQNTAQGRSTRLPLVAGGILLLGLGIFLGRSFETPKPASAASRDTTSKVARDKNAMDQERLAVLEQQVLRLQADGMRQQLPAAQASEQAAPKTAEVTDPSAPKPDRAEAARLAELARLKFLDGLADKVNTEPRDPSFRNQTEPVIAQLLPERFGAGVTVDKISCASSICRARVSHPGSTHLSNEKLTAFLDKRGALASLELQLDTREDGVTTLYFLRQQEPQPEQ